MPKLLVLITVRSNHGEGASMSMLAHQRSIRVTAVLIAVLVCCAYVRCRYSEDPAQSAEVKVGVPKEGSSQPHATNPLVLIITDRSCGKTINASLGRSVLIELKSTPGTGYSWAVTKDDPKYLAIVNSTVKPSAKSAPGRPSLQLFEIRTLSVGQGTLRFSYLRPWERDVQPIRNCEITVLVGSPSPGTKSLQ